MYLYICKFNSSFKISSRVLEYRRWIINIPELFQWIRDTKPKQKIRDFTLHKKGVLDQDF